MLNAENCIITNAALCEVLSIWWRPILNCLVYRYCNFIGNHMIRFTAWHKTVHTFYSASSAHLGMTFAYFWFWIPRNKPKKDSTEALMRKASDWNWRCQRGLGIIYISTGFLSAFRFWKFHPKLYWIFNCDFWIWPLCTFTDRISQTHEYDTFWYMQWHQEVIAELIVLYFINFHWVERKLWEYKLSGYFLFLLSIYYILGLNLCLYTHNVSLSFFYTSMRVSSCPKAW